MQRLGQTFREAREARGVTPSEAAKDTRMLVQHVTALESEDFHKMPAPVYARGFIKLYAEYLGLDPEPLLEDYAQRLAPRKRAPLTRENAAAAARAEAEEDKRVSAQPGAGLVSRAAVLWDRLRRGVSAISAEQIKRLALVAAAILLLLLLVSALRSCARRHAESVRARVAETQGLLVEPAPEPYVDDALLNAAQRTGGESPP